jgi:hypothetical protein
LLRAPLVLRAERDARSGRMSAASTIAQFSKPRPSRLKSRHPEVTIGSDDGMFSNPCHLCEAMMDMEAYVDDFGYPSGRMIPRKGSEILAII